MKIFTKKTALFVAAVALSLSANAGIVNQLSGDNSNFDGGTTGGWGAWGNTSISIQTEGGESHCEVFSPGADGTGFCLHLNCNKAGQIYESQAAYNVTLTAGTTYYIKFKAKSNVNNASFQVALQNSSNYDGESYRDINLTTDWKEYSLELPCTKAGMNRLIFGFGATVADYYIDDIEFGEQGEIYIANQLKNDDFNFEGGTTGSWSSWGTCGVDVEGDHTEAVTPGHDGSGYCMHLNSTTSGDMHGAQAGCNTEIELGEDYILRFKAKGAGTIQFMFQNGTNYEACNYTDFNLTSDWKTYTATMSPKQEGMTRIVIQYGGTAGDYYFDDIEFGVETTAGINTIQTTTNSAAYNLQGMKVSNDYKGLVIKNGKKVIR